jgi:hypothetical protein
VGGTRAGRTIPSCPTSGQPAVETIDQTEAWIEVNRNGEVDRSSSPQIAQLLRLCRE